MFSNNLGEKHIAATRPALAADLVSAQRAISGDKTNRD